jgi:hypothetical protein
MEEQLLDFKRLLEAKFPNNSIGDFSGVALDIVICDDVTTSGAGATQQVTVGLHLGPRFERLVAALKTGEFVFVRHIIEDLQSSDHVSSDKD